MTAVLSVYGRLGQDPKPISTTSGKAMAVVSMAADIPARGEEHHSEWFGLVAFGELAERLLKHQAGEMVAVTGRLQLNTWTDREGQTRQQWQVVVDTLVSARTVRPGGKRKGQPQGQGQPNGNDRQQASFDAQEPGPEPDFNDPIPF